MTQPLKKAPCDVCREYAIREIGRPAYDPASKSISHYEMEYVKTQGDNGSYDNDSGQRRRRVLQMLVPTITGFGVRLSVHQISLRLTGWWVVPTELSIHIIAELPASAHVAVTARSPKSPDAI